MKQYILIVISVLSLKLFAQDVDIYKTNICENRVQFNRGDLISICWNARSDQRYFYETYLSRDTILDISDKLLFDFYRNSGGSNIDHYRVDCQENVSGWYHVIIKADHENLIAETDETNNIGITDSLYINVPWPSNCGVQLELEKDYYSGSSDYDDLNDGFSFSASLNVESHIGYNYDFHELVFFLSKDKNYDYGEGDDIVLDTDPYTIDIPSDLDSGVTYSTNFTLSDSWMQRAADGLYYLGVIFKLYDSGAQNGSVDFVDYYFNYDNLEDDPNGRIKIGNPSVSVGSELNPQEKSVIAHYNIHGQLVSQLKPLVTYIVKFDDGTFEKVVYQNL